MTSRNWKGLMAAGVLLAGTLAIAGPAQRPAAPVKPAWAAQDVLMLTCAQAWEKAGKGYQGMLAIVTTLARVSLINRGLTFPNTREAGLEAGRGISEDCKADPNSLLFAIVDKHVRRVADAAANPGK
jgi:hypothetical protein